MMIGEPIERSIVETGIRKMCIRDRLKEQQMAGEMTTALDQGQFVPFFQPQYCYATGRMIGAEVLARWKRCV